MTFIKVLVTFNINRSEKTSNAIIPTGQRYLHNPFRASNIAKRINLITTAVLTPLTKYRHPSIEKCRVLTNTTNATSYLVCIPQRLSFNLIYSCVAKSEANLAKSVHALSLQDPRLLISQQTEIKKPMNNALKLIFCPNYPNPHSFEFLTHCYDYRQTYMYM